MRVLNWRKEGRSGKTVHCDVKIPGRNMKLVVGLESIYREVSRKIGGVMSGGHIAKNGGFQRQMTTTSGRYLKP